MAGAGAKLFASGDVLTAAQVNTYLMDQSVMRFADATARTNAFGGAGEPVLAEGMLSYLDSDNTVYVYDGSAWKAVGVASTIDAKGDLLVGTADNTVGRLAVGTNGQVLTADSTQTTGLKWSPAGKVLQVVSATKTDTFTTTSTAFVDITGLSVSITPTATTSKVLVAYTIRTAVSGDIWFGQRLVRGSTDIFLGDTAGSRVSVTTGHAPGVSGNADQVTQAIIFLDSPSTTSATTYKIQGRVNTGTGYINRGSGDADTGNSLRYPSSITVMEISA